MTHRFEVGERIRVKPGRSLGIGGQTGHVTDQGSATDFYRIKLDNGRKGLMVREDDLELITEDERSDDQPANLLDHW